MLNKMMSFLRDGIIDDNKGTDALEYVGMAIVIVRILQSVASHIAGEIGKGTGINLGG